MNSVFFVFSACTLLVSDNNRTSLLIVLLSHGYQTRYNNVINETLASWRLQLQKETTLKLYDVLVSHEMFSDIHTKSIVPMLPKLFNVYKNIDWFLLVKPNTEINISFLANLLLQYKEPQKYPYFLGHGLYDTDHTIIHHYAPPSLLYPLDCAGFALSHQVLNRASNHWMEFNPTFTIDSFYELSLFIKYMKYPSPTELHPSVPPAHQNGVLLTHLPQFCIDSYHSNCATMCRMSQFHNCLTGVDSTTISDVFFAIKTCQKFHHKRIPIQLNTWVTHSTGLRIQYYSDVADKMYGTTYVGVPNTDRGHCAKMLRILHLSITNNEFKWLVLADDDTLLSVHRLLHFLDCHNSTASVIIGEMYGYQATKSNGYLYPTAGAGVIFSRPAVEKIVSSQFTCPSADYPDDMFLGSLTRILNISLFDSSLFHQNQPLSYHSQLLSLEKPISFHRLSPQDPLDIYHNFLDSEKQYRTEL